MLTRAAVVTEARTWLGAPYHSLAASRHGVDCVGLVIGVAMAIGLVPASWRPPEYLSPEWCLHSQAERLLDAVRTSGVLHEIALLHIAEGDIVAFAWQEQPVSHLAFLSRMTPYPCILHAVQQAGRVVEHGLQGRWGTGVRRAFRFCGVRG